MSETRPSFVRKYLALTKASMMESLAFRTSIFVTILGNLVYLIMIYFLWQAIYASSPTPIVNGMTFYDTMVYLVLAAAMFNFLECFIVWSLGRDFQSGQIVVSLTKPIDYQVFTFFAVLGQYIMAFLTTFLPTFIIVCLMTKGGVPLGINLIFLVISMVFSVIINFCVDFFVGVICFYTQSIWGINVMKEVVVALLSGAAIPLAFFPAVLRKIIRFLPFHAIYNTPLQILTDESLTLTNYLEMLINQVFWVVLMIGITRIFWNASKKFITVNGG